MKTIVGIFVALLLGLMFLGYWDLSKKIHQPSAVINMEQLYHSFDMSKDLEKKYVQLSKERGVAIDSLSMMIRRLQSDKNNQGNAVAVNQKLQTATYAQVNLQKENETMKLELEQQIWKQLNQYLYQFGQEQKYSIILGAQGNGNVIYVQSTVDITDIAIEFINNKYRGIN